MSAAEDTRLRKIRTLTQELKLWEQRYQELYDNAPDMMAAVDPKTGCIRECNQTLASAIGIPKEEIIGRSFISIYHPNSVGTARELFDIWLNTGKIPVTELQLCRRDGSGLDVALKVASVCDKEGNILYSSSIWRDVTERRSVENDLRKAHELLEERVLSRTADLELANRELKRWADIFTHIGVAVVVADSDGAIQLLNPAAEKMYGAPASRFQNVRDLYAPETRTELDGHVRNLRNKGHYVFHLEARAHQR